MYGIVTSMLEPSAILKANLSFQLPGELEAVRQQ
jgi:hypothetical protein